MSDEKPIGTIDVDATQPLINVVDELLRLANKRVFAVVRRRSRGLGIRVPLRRRGFLPLLDSDVLVVIGLDSRPKVRSRREGVARPFDEPVWFPGKRSARQIAHKNRRRRQENESLRRGLPPALPVQVDVNSRWMVGPS